MKRTLNICNIGIIFLLSLIFLSCSEDYTPKPVGYFRIDFPERKYVPREFGCPFSFEAPVYSQLELFTNEEGEQNCWLNVAFPGYGAKLHLTYIPLQGDLRRYIEESRGMTYEHQIKASKIESSKIVRDSSKVYGLSYELSGEVASASQFYLTDSTRHFLRGSLYFNSRTNADSLEPVIKFLQQDIDHLINSLEWNQANQPG